MTKYKVFDDEDDSYVLWIGTVTEIKKYLLNQYNNGENPMYDSNEDWRENLQNYGLCFLRVK